MLDCEVWLTYSCLIQVAQHNRKKPSRHKGQLALHLPKPKVGWGGARRGSGPTRDPKNGVMHRARERFERPAVLHVTLRFCADLPTLRQGVAFIKVRQALLESARGPCVDNGAARFRLAHFSIQHDHLHLVVEASNWRCLSRGMHALKVRLARSLNGALSRRGPVFTERYHARRLRSPSEVRNVLCYVLNNARKHRGRRSQPQPGWIDPCSSACWFDGWRRPPPECDPQSCPLPSARTWLLAKGWRRGAAGLLATDEVPWPNRKRASAAASSGRRFQVKGRR